jgi:hypothetical protein
VNNRAAGKSVQGAREQKVAHALKNDIRFSPSLPDLNKRTSTQNPKQRGGRSGLHNTKSSTGTRIKIFLETA